MLRRGGVRGGEKETIGRIATETLADGPCLVVDGPLRVFGAVQLADRDAVEVRDRRQELQIRAALAVPSTAARPKSSATTTAC